MPSPSATPVAYDFRRPNKFTREHVRALQIASETFARQFTTVLSTTLRTVSHVHAKGIHQLTYAFESLTALAPVVIHQESNPQFAQIGSPSDMVIVFVYDLRIGGQEGEATLCVPFASLQPVLDEVAANSLLAGRVEADAESVRGALAGRMGGAPVTVNVCFQPIVLTMADIVDLRPGDVLPLDHRVDEPLEVSVGGVP